MNADHVEEEETPAMRTTTSHHDHHEAPGASPQPSADQDDPASAQHLAGATLDYKDGLQGAGFHIENPSAQRSCGCGQSFS